MQWADTFLILWFLISLSLAWMRQYKHTLYANIALCLSFAVYAYLIGQHVATAIPLIAASTSIIQLFMPASNEKRHVYIRNFIAIASAVMACILLYQKPIDIFPCLGFTAIRLGEAQQSARIMKGGFLLGMSFWMVFAIFESLHLLILFEVIIITTFFYRFWRVQRLKKIEEIFNDET